MQNPYHEIIQLPACDKLSINKTEQTVRRKNDETSKPYELVGAVTIAVKEGMYSVLGHAYQNPYEFIWCGRQHWLFLRLE